MSELNSDFLITRDSRLQILETIFFWGIAMAIKLNEGEILYVGSLINQNSHFDEKQMIILIGDPLSNTKYTSIKDAFDEEGAFIFPNVQILHQYIFQRLNAKNAKIDEIEEMLFSKASKIFPVNLYSKKKLKIGKALADKLALETVDVFSHSIFLHILRSGKRDYI